MSDVEPLSWDYVRGFLSDSARVADVLITSGASVDQSWFIGSRDGLRLVRIAFYHWLSASRPLSGSWSATFYRMRIDEGQYHEWWQEEHHTFDDSVRDVMLTAADRYLSRGTT